jgi:hypothetical protein
VAWQRPAADNTIVSHRGRRRRGGWCARRPGAYCAAHTRRDAARIDVAGRRGLAALVSYVRATVAVATPSWTASGSE